MAVPLIDAFPNVVCCLRCRRIFFASFIDVHWRIRGAHTD